jgi:regulator of sigma E protease
VHVEIFSIGFGPELFGWNDAKGTRWKFSLVPLGGYVKMYGDTDPASARAEDIESIPAARMSEAFFAKPVAQRAAIVFAGPAINYIFAIIVMAFVFAINGQPLTPPHAAAVISGSAAEKAGFKPGDNIIAIDGESVQSFEDIRRSMLISLDQELTFTVDRGGENLEIKALPEKKEHKDRFGFKSSRGFLGLVSPQHAVPLEKIVNVDGKVIEEGDDIHSVIEPLFGRDFWIEIDGGGEEVDRYIVSPQAEMNPDFLNVDYVVLSAGEPEIFVKYSPVEAGLRALYETWSITSGTLEALGQMFTGQRSAQELGGLIRIGAIAGDVAQNGAVALLMFAALLSINLGLINLFPIPVLDGGHLVFYALEAIRGKPVPEKAQDYAFKAGFVILIGLMLFANVNDLVQLFL